MARMVVYDMTRLWLAGLRPTPRGIERVDVAFASQLAAHWPGEVMGLCWTPWGVRVFGREGFKRLVDAVIANWQESTAASDDPTYRKLAAWVRNEAAFEPDQIVPPLTHLSRRVKSAFGLLREAGFAVGSSAYRSIPQGAIYVNFGHVGFAAPSIAALFAERPDIKRVALVHDLLSLSTPQFFPEANHDYFTKVLERIKRYADLVVTTTAVVEADYLKFAASGARPGQKVNQIALGPVLAGVPQPEIDPGLRQNPYFMMCGTREPRKNHLFILKLWRRLCEQQAQPPKLILVGGHGWSSQHVTAILDRCPPTQGHIVRTETLKSPGYFKLLANCRGLLAASFAEGFGLPVAEALRLGTPVAASKIEAFAEHAGVHATLLNPLDGLAWLRWIETRTHAVPMDAEQQRTLASVRVEQARKSPDILDLLMGLG